MTVIVDASVALKWVLTEDGTDRARALITQRPLAAPDLLWVECTNVLWVKARRGQITAQGEARARRYFGAATVVPVAATDDVFPSYIPVSEDSQDILAYVSQPVQARKPVAYQRDFLDAYVPNTSWYLQLVLGT